MLKLEKNQFLDILDNHLGETIILNGYFIDIKKKEPISIDKDFYVDMDFIFYMTAANFEFYYGYIKTQYEKIIIDEYVTV